MPGDFSICFECGGASRYNEDMTMRPLTPEDAEKADINTLMQMLILQSQIIGRNSKESKH